MNKKIFLVALVLVALFGCQAAPNPTRANPTARPNVSSGDSRTVIARPEGTETPSSNVVIEEEPGVTGAVPTNTLGSTSPETTPQAPAEQPSPLPTADIVRPLLPTANPTSPGVAPNTPKQGTIGTAIDFGSAAITVNGLERTPGREGDAPRPGNEYLVVSVTLQNKSNRQLTFDASQFALQATDRTVIDYEDVTFQDNLLRTANLEANTKQDVFLVFQIPSGSTGYTLVLGDPAVGSVANIRLN